LKKKILERRSILENRKKNRTRRKIDHAKFIIAGEILKTEIGKTFLQKLSKDKEYSKGGADALALLAAEFDLKLSFKVKDTVRSE
jgi:hypothetical protein